MNITKAQLTRLMLTFLLMAGFLALRAEEPKKKPPVDTSLATVPWMKGSPITLPTVNDDGLAYYLSSTGSLGIIDTALTVPAAFTIVKDNKPILTIKLSGEVVFGEGVTPTEAAKQFAEALRKMLPEKFACEEKK